VLQADGKIVLAGWFTTLAGQPRSKIGRLNPDGSLDTTFNPGADESIDSLGLQADGKILVGGHYSTLGGQPRSRIGRLSSMAPALQNLEVDPQGATITWMRSGTSPEVWRTPFELSTDGIAYIPIGAGIRIPGGWQLTGLALPHNQNLFIRARGYYATSFHMASNSVLETIWDVYLPKNSIYLPLVMR
jgi:hypothetical protein